MTTYSEDAIATLIAKEEIRELALLYCRGVDRQDFALLRDLYTEDATDTHGDTFDGPAKDYVNFLEKSLPYLQYSGHHVCNHLISVDGDTGEGEVYALAYHVIPDGKGGFIEDLIGVRYLDHYRKETDGRWRFAKRLVTYDMRRQTPVTSVQEADARAKDYLSTILFARGPRK